MVAMFVASDGASTCATSTQNPNSDLIYDSGGMENVAQGAGILRRPSLDQFVHVIRFHVPKVDLPAVWPGWNKRFTTRSSTSEAM